MYLNVDFLNEMTKNVQGTVNILKMKSKMHIYCLLFK